jgi:hypothetical protein
MVHLNHGGKLILTHKRILRLAEEIFFHLLCFQVCAKNQFSLFWCSRDGWIVHFLVWLLGLLDIGLFICSYEVVVLAKFAIIVFFVHAIGVCIRSFLLIPIKFLYFSCIPGLEVLLIISRKT